jgi:hypothetical protein
MIEGKHLKKLEKSLGKTTIGEMDKLTPESLKAIVIDAEQTMKKAKAELEANPKFVEHRDSLNALKGGLKSLNARHRARIAYALHRLDLATEAEGVDAQVHVGSISLNGKDSAHV